MIRVSEVLNPFEPRTRIEHEVDLGSGAMLSEVLIAAGLSPEKSIAVIGGKGIPPDLAAGFPVEGGEHIIVMPYVGGGGSFWRSFAEIAVLAAAALVTYGLSTGFALAGGLFAIGGGMSAGAAALVGSGVALGGNLLVSAFMSPSVGGGGNDSATYDPTGPKTVSSGGTPIPKGYGTMRWGGNVIASYVTAEGQDNYLNVLVCFGWGPALSISDIRINNNPISDYRNVLYQTRLGSNDQAPIPYFNNVVNGYGQATRCIAGDPVTVSGTGTTTQGLEVTVQFPQGVFWNNPKGGQRTLSIAYKVEYSVSGSGAWQSAIMPRTTQDLITYRDDGTVLDYPGWVVVPSDTIYSSGITYAHDNNKSLSAHTPGDSWSGTQTVTYYNADGSSYTGSIFLQGTWEVCDPSLNQQSVSDWYSGYEIFTDLNTATLYHTTKIYNLPPNKYDVRITKYGSAFAGDAIQPLEANNANTGDQMWLHNINEVQYQDLAYPNMILLGVRALATDQLSGSGLNITAQISHGINVSLPAELAPYGVDNPAVVAYDAMVSDAALYGGGLNPSQLNAADLAAWAAFNDELVSDGVGGTIRRHVFNGVFDQSGMNLWKAVQKIAAMSQCIPVQQGRNYGFIIDTPVDVPAQVFTVGNISRDSLSDVWMALDDRANSVEVTFADAARDYRSDEPCSVMTQADINAGVTVQTTRANLLGCTNRAQAWHWAYRHLKQSKAATLTRSFSVNIDAVACQIGSVIGVQDDTTQWAEGGRIQPGSTSSVLIVDRSDLTYAPSAGWTVSVVHPVVLRGTARVSAVIGNLVSFTAALPAGRLLRCVRADGTEVTVEQYNSMSVLLESAATFASGDVVSLYDQDVVDTQLVSACNGSTLTLASPFIQAPTVDAPWVYGQSGGVFPAKLFRVTNLRRKGDFDITIDAIIYDPSVYADDTPIITETIGVPDLKAGVSGLNAVENYAVSQGGDSGQQSTISVGWQNGPATAKTEIWVAQNEANQPLSNEVLLATVSKGTTFTFPASTGSIVQVRAVGVDAKGTTASWNNAPIVTITVQGAGAAPGDVTSFTGVSSSSGTAFSWVAPTGAVDYEIRYNPDIGNANWSGALLLWSGSALTWTDSTVRTGLYLIKALTSNSVESINAATYNHLLSSIGNAPPPIAYAVLSNSLVLNGNFVSGNVDGWLGGDATFAGGGLVLEPGSTGIISASFEVIPGNKYRIAFTGGLDGAGTQNVTHRLFYAAAYVPHVADATGTVADLQTGAFLTNTLTTYTYEWTCPAGIHYASVALYELGTAPLFYSNISVQDYGVVAQAGADKTADQPIVYTGSNLVPNGTFLFGNIDGWFSPDNVADYDSGVTGLLLGTSVYGVISPSFPVIPGQKYRVTFTGQNTQPFAQSVYHRIAGSGVRAANIDPNATGNYLHDFLSGGSLVPARTTYTYDWTCPTGIYFASLAMYETGAAQLGYTNVSVQDYAGAGEWGIGNGSGTAGDTVYVNGVPSPSISPIAGLMPTETGADKTLNHVLTTSVAEPILNPSGANVLLRTGSRSGTGPYVYSPTAYTLVDYNVTVNDPSDVFNLLANVRGDCPNLADRINYANAAGLPQVLGYVDTPSVIGTAPYFGGTQPSTASYQTFGFASGVNGCANFFGSVTGLSVGSHTLSLVFLNYTLYDGTNTGNAYLYYIYSQLQQISS